MRPSSSGCCTPKREFQHLLEMPLLTCPPSTEIMPRENVSPVRRTDPDSGLPELRCVRLGQILFLPWSVWEASRQPHENWDATSALAVPGRDVPEGIRPKCTQKPTMPSSWSYFFLQSSPWVWFCVIAEGTEVVGVGPSSEGFSPCEERRVPPGFPGGTRSSITCGASYRGFFFDLGKALASCGAGN